jgi:ABC-type lipoprotein release transport system permease subunit
MGISLRLAWRNIWRQPRRTGLTLAAIVFSDVILVWMIGLQLGQYDLMIENTLRTFTGHVQVQAPGYLDKPQMRRVIDNAEKKADLLRKELSNAEERFGVARISVRASGFALASSEERSYGAQIYGVQPKNEPKVSTIPGLVKEGHYLSSNNAQEAVIGSVMARNLKVKLGDELTLLGSGKDGSIAAAVLPIVGIFHSGSTDIDRYFIQIPLHTFQDIFSMQNSAHTIVAAEKSYKQSRALQQRLRAILGNDNNVDVIHWEKLQPGLRQAIQADFSTAWLMYGVLVLLVGFSVLNTFLMSVLERTREFGIILALGLTPGKVGRLVMLESFLMALAGMVMGILVGAIFTSYFVFNGFSYPGMEDMAMKFNLPDRIYPVLNEVSLTLGPLVIFIATMIAALWPAIRIHLLNPVEAMQTA